MKAHPVRGAEVSGSKNYCGGSGIKVESNTSK